MTLKIFKQEEEEEANTSTNISQQQTILLTSSIGGKAIDRCSPHLRDPLRAKTLNPLLPKPPNSSRQASNARSKGKKKSKSSEKRPVEYNSPASSQRYLLGDRNPEEFVEKEHVPRVIVNDFPCKVEDSSVVLNPLEESRLVKVEAAKNDARDSSSSSSSSSPLPSSSSSSLSSSSSSGSRPQEQQVVVLKVSLHCKGCEGKVRKHISRMAGVTSFDTDLANKKVTVMGDVTPLGVLNSISKVKNAQLWPSPPPAARHQSTALI